MITDRVSTGGFLVIVSHLYPAYTFHFVMLLVLDISSHWFHVMRYSIRWIRHVRGFKKLFLLLWMNLEPREDCSMNSNFALISIQSSNVSIQRNWPPQIFSSPATQKPHTPVLLFHLSVVRLLLYWHRVLLYSFIYITFLSKSDTAFGKWGFRSAV